MCGRPVTIPNGHCHFLGGVAKGVPEVTRLTGELVEQGADVIKVMATGGNMTVTSDPLKAQFTWRRCARSWAWPNAAGLRVTAHARGVEGIRVAAEANAHGIEHCRMEVGTGEWQFDHELARMLADKGIFAAPTLAASYRAFQRQAAGGKVGIRAGAIPFATRQKNAAMLREAGIRVVVGTDAGALALPLRRGGARGDGGARGRGLDAGGGHPRRHPRLRHRGRRREDLGSLEAGKLADVVVVRGNPARSISDVRQVEAVYLNGRRVASRGPRHPRRAADAVAGERHRHPHRVPQHRRGPAPAEGLRRRSWPSPSS